MAFDGMASGWLEEGETDYLDYDIGPRGAVRYECYVKAMAPSGHAKVKCSVFARKPDGSPYWIGDFVLQGSSDGRHAPERDVKAFAKSAGHDFTNHFSSGYIEVVNEGPRVKVWRSRYAGPK